MLFGELDAEELPNVCIKYSVNSVPTILFIRNRNVVERLVGADVRNYAERVLKHASDVSIIYLFRVSIVLKRIIDVKI